MESTNLLPDRNADRGMSDMCEEKGKTLLRKIGLVLVALALIATAASVNIT